MKKLFLIFVCLTSLTTPLLASDFPTLSPLGSALPSQTEPQELDPTEALLEAVGAQDIKTAEEALKRGARGEDISLAFPAYTGNSAILRLLVDHRAAKRLPLNLDQQDDRGKTSLYHACFNGSIECAEVLLTAGANPFLTIAETDFFHTQGDTALNAACKKCPVSIVELLVRQGGRRLINTTNEHGRSCLHDLCREEIDLEKLALLLLHSADVNLPDGDGNTPFHYACYPKRNKDSQQKALTLLMEHNADTAILNHGGKGPKNSACASGFLLDTTNHRALDAYSDEAISLRMAQKAAAAASVAQKQPATPLIQCSICVSEEEPQNESHKILACNHGYHRACVDEWIARNQSCPLCRGKNITEKK